VFVVLVVFVFGAKFTRGHFVLEFVKELLKLGRATHLLGAELTHLGAELTHHTTRALAHTLLLDNLDGEHLFLEFILNRNLFETDLLADLFKHNRLLVKSVLDLGDGNHLGGHVGERRDGLLQDGLGRNWFRHHDGLGGSRGLDKDGRNGFRGHHGHHGLGGNREFHGRNRGWATNEFGRNHTFVRHNHHRFRGTSNKRRNWLGSTGHFTICIKPHYLL
jgi:hypothetical protein